MADSCNTDGSLAIGQLVENPVCANPQRVQTAQFASECIASMRFSLQQAQCVLDRVYQRPVEFEQFPPGTAGKNEPCQRSAGGGSTLGKLVAKFREGDSFVALDLGEPSLQSGKGIRVGEDLSGLL